jgi:hypothetical protein
LVIGVTADGASDLADLGELQLDRGLTTEDVDKHLELELIFVDLNDLALEVRKRTFLDPDGFAHAVLQPWPSLAGWLFTVFFLGEERLDVFARQRRRLVACADKSGATGSVANNKPRVIIEPLPEG